MTTVAGDIIMCRTTVMGDGTLEEGDVVGRTNGCETVVEGDIVGRSRGETPMVDDVGGRAIADWEVDVEGRPNVVSISSTWREMSRLAGSGFLAGMTLAGGLHLSAALPVG